MGSVSAWPDQRLSTKKNRAIQELVQGQDCANQLQLLFHETGSSSPSPKAKEQLVEKILRSFNQTIAVLSSVDDSPADVASNHDSPCCDDERRSQDSSIESRKRPFSKDKRGCYKRKKAEQTRTNVSATMEDGHAWRKYGQKAILNSKYPRSYFRCTRKHDQGCGATKQVQRLEDGSQMYRTTYIGTHTCTNYAPQIIQGSASWETCTVDNGDSKTPIGKLHDQSLNPATPIVKQEETPTPTPSDLTDLDSMMWKDLMGGGGDGFEYCSEPAAMDSNVYPYTEISSRNFELDFVMKPLEFENEFEFDDRDECLL